MKNQQDKNLLVFGYGIAFIVPYILAFRMLPEKPHFIVIILTLFLFLFILNAIERPRMKFVYHGLLIFIYSLNVLFGFQCFNKGSFFLFGGIWSALLLALSGTCFVITKRKPNILKPIFNLWMRAARFVGEAFSVIILAGVFYLLFAPIGIFLRIIKKDFLDQKIEPEKKSYWRMVDGQELDKNQYLKQF